MPTTRSSFRIAAKLEPYCLQYLSAHLYDAQLANKLYCLVTHRKWLNCSTKFDPSGLQYREDIGWAFKAAAGQIEMNLQDHRATDMAKYLVRPAALAWLSGNYGQSARLLSIRVLEAMVRLGDVDQAIRRAEGVPDPILRAEALIRVGKAAFSAGIEPKARSVWSQTQELLLRTPTDMFNDKFSTMAQLIHALMQAGQKEEAVAVANQIEAEVEIEIERAGGVTSSAHIARAAAWGALCKKKRVLAAVESLTDTGFQIRALAAAAGNSLTMNRVLAFEILDVALERVFTIDAPEAEYDLALVLAEAGRKTDAFQVAGENLSDVRRMLLMAALARGQFIQGDTEAGNLLLAEIFRKILAKKPSKEYLRLVDHLTSFGMLCDEIKHFSGISALVKKIRDKFEGELNASEWGTVALGLAAYGDVPSAKTAIAAALNWKPPVDDWQENAALSELAELLGQSSDREGLAWVLSRAKNCRGAWQQAELAYHLTKGYQTTGDDAKATEAEQIMQAAALGQNNSSWRPKAQGILAVWYTMDNNAASAATGREIVNRTIEEMEKHDTSADDLTELARTLAHRDATDLAKIILTRAIAAIQRETDPNTVARAVGAAAETAAIVKETATIGALIQIAATIDIDCLQAEALFWLAGWQAYHGNYGGARQTFYEAVAKGLEHPPPPEDIETIWRHGQLEYLEDIARNTGWPSTEAAALFGGLMLALEIPEQARIMRGLVTLDNITEGYDHIRNVCHRILIQSADTLPDQGSTASRYWIQALEHNKELNVGEVWAVIGACLPTLAFRFGNTFIRSLWVELSRVQDLNL